MKTHFDPTSFFGGKKPRKTKKKDVKPAKASKPKLKKARLLPERFSAQIEKVTACIDEHKEKFKQFKVDPLYHAAMTVFLPEKYYLSTTSFELKTQSLSPILKKAEMRNPSSSLYKDDPEALDDLNSKLQTLLGDSYGTQIGQDGNMLYETLGNGRISKYAQIILDSYEKLCIDLKEPKRLKGRNLTNEALLQCQFLFVLVPDETSCLAIIVFDAGERFPTLAEFEYAYLGIKAKRLSIKIIKDRNALIIRTSPEYHIIFKAELNKEKKIDNIQASAWRYEHSRISEILYSPKQIYAFANNWLSPKPNPTEMKEIKSFISDFWKNDQFIPQFRLKLKFKSDNEPLISLKILHILKTEYDIFDIYICQSASKTLFQSYVLSYYPPSGKEILAPRIGMPKYAAFGDLKSAVKFGNLELKTALKNVKDKPDLNLPAMYKLAEMLIRSRINLINTIVQNFNFPSDLDLDFDNIELL